MRNVLLAIGIAAIAAAGLAAAPKDDVPVTISACLHDGEGDTYVLTNVMENGAPAAAVYWLSTTDGLKDHVGHQIEVSGTYSPSRDAGKTAKVKIETDADDGEVKVAVENGMKKAEFEEPIASVRSGEPGAVGTSGVVGTSGTVADSTMEIVRPYRRLEVKTIKMIAGSCS